MVSFLPFVSIFTILGKVFPFWLIFFKWCLANLLFVYFLPIFGEDIPKLMSIFFGWWLKTSAKISARGVLWKVRGGESVVTHQSDSNQAFFRCCTMMCHEDNWRGGEHQITQWWFYVWYILYMIISTFWKKRLLMIMQSRSRSVNQLVVICWQELYKLGSTGTRPGFQSPPEEGIPGS